MKRKYLTFQVQQSTILIILSYYSCFKQQSGHGLTANGLTECILFETVTVIKESQLFELISVNRFDL